MSTQSAAAPILYLVPPRDGSDGWITAEDVLAMTGWSRTTLFRRRRELVSRESAQTGPNGRPLREYLAASIPAAEKLAGECHTSTEESALVQPPQPPLFASQPPSQRVTLPDRDDQAQAEERLIVLQPILAFKQNAAAWQSMGITSQSRLIEYQAKQTGNSVRTIKGWLARWREGGFPALADRKRSDRDQSRWFNAHRDAALLAAAWYLEFRQSCRACHEAIVRDRERLGLAEDELPTYETVRAWLKSTPQHLQAFAREGRKRYHESFAPYLPAAYIDLRPNQVWVADTMIHDVEVANDCFPELEWGAPMRLRFTSIMDRRSRYFVGYSWCPEGSSRSITTALRRAIAHFGPCEHFYCDNGKDYRKVAKGARPGYLASDAAIRGWEDAEMREIEKVGLLGRLGIAVTHCLPFHPQSKNIERAYGTVHQFDKLFWQHYTGGAPHLRPDATTAAMALHRKLLKHGEVASTTHPPASFFIAACSAWIEQEYHQRPHSGEGMNGRAPSEVFALRGEQLRPVDASEMALLFFERERRRVRECAVELRRRRYTYAPGDMDARDALHRLTECDVLVAYDPNDPSEVAILDEDGHFLCSAREQEKIAFNPADAQVQERIASSMADRRHLEKKTRELVESIAAAARSTGAASPVESLVRSTKAPQSIAPALTHRAPRVNDSPAAGAASTTPAQAARLLVEGLRK